MKRLVTIEIDNTALLADLVDALRDIGFEVRARGFDLTARPIHPERHTNANVIKFPRHSRQLHRGAEHPNPPGVA